MKTIKELEETEDLFGSIAWEINEAKLQTLQEVLEEINKLRRKYNQGFTNQDLEELKQKIKGK